MIKDSIFFWCFQRQGRVQRFQACWSQKSRWLLGRRMLKGIVVSVDELYLVSRRKREMEKSGRNPEQAINQDLFVAPCLTYPCTMSECIEQEAHSFISYHPLSPFIALPSLCDSLRAPYQFIIEQSLDRSFAQSRTSTLSRSPILHLSTTNTHPFSNCLLYIIESTKRDIQIPQNCWR